MASSRLSSRPKNLDSRHGRPGWHHRHKVILSFQDLEQRWLMAKFSVGDTNNSGAGSLRQAITDSNAAPGSNTIDFSFSIGTGTQTIHPVTPLAAITNSVLIDATTQPGFSGTSLITLDGLPGGSANGFELPSAGSNQTIRGLVINVFYGDAILIDGASGVTIAGNFIGSYAVSNSEGVVVQSSATRSAAQPPTRLT